MDSYSCFEILRMRAKAVCGGVVYAIHRSEVQLDSWNMPGWHQFQVDYDIQQKRVPRVCTSLDRVRACKDSGQSTRIIVIVTIVDIDDVQSLRACYVSVHGRIGFATCSGHANTACFKQEFTANVHRLHKPGPDCMTDCTNLDLTA